MRSLSILLFLTILFASYTEPENKTKEQQPTPVTQVDTVQLRHQMYDDMHLSRWICYEAFERGLSGAEQIERNNKDVLTLIDFSKPSTAERLVVLDLRQKKILHTSVVSHGRNSGGNYATSFSNQNGSYKSSLGFYLTENTYQGKHGTSLVLNGLEKGFNDQAKQRAIVIHGASYTNPAVAASAGRLGRSLGCPALPLSNYKPIINTIKNGTLLFIYANDRHYLAHSSILASDKHA